MTASASASAAPMPVSVIGGYLGSGKTTLINRLLRGADGLRIAVMVNDFGAINIDADLIREHNGDTISLSNGCICCSMGSGLTVAMTELAETPGRFDHVVIEVSGVGDPWKVAQWGRTPGFVLDGVVVLAAADQVQQQGRDRYIGDTIERQLYGADLVVVTRGDLVADSELDECVAWVRQYSRTAPTVAQTDDLPLSYVLGVRAGASAGPGDAAAQIVEMQGTHAAHETWTIRVPLETTLDDLNAWLSKAPDGVVRAKGTVQCAGEATAHVVQKVGHRVEVDRRAVSDPDDLVGRLVAIAAPGVDATEVAGWVAAIEDVGSS